MTFRFVDLFAGIGGMRIGFEGAGGQCVMTCEIDRFALETYKLNFQPSGEHKFFFDITDVDSNAIPEYEVLVAGFPCQPFSIAGLRKGLQDSRGAVFLEILRILETTQPKAFLLENVKGLLAHDGGATFLYMTNLLEELGYHLKFEILNSMVHANIPQNRERVFIVGFLEQDSADNFTFPRPIKLSRSIQDALELDMIDQKYFYNQRYKCFEALSLAMTSEETLYQWRRHYVRENKSNVCPTLTANMGAGGHNVPLVKTEDGIRKLTPRECANFQGFPQAFKFPKQSDSRLYHQLGNSVTIPLIRRISKEIAICV